MSKYKDTSIRNMRNGNDSKTIDKYLKGLDLSCLNKVDQLEFKSLIEEIIARGIALDIDNYSRKYLVDKLKTFGSKVMHYENDLAYTQSKLADMQKSIQFHETALKDLKQRYLETQDLDVRKDLYTQIAEIEKILSSYRSQLNSLLDLRNKIRKEIDKKSELVIETNGSINKNTDYLDLDYTVLSETK